MKRKSTTDVNEMPKEISPAERRAIADELRLMRGELSRKYGTFSDSVDVIREMRDSRP